MKTPGDFIFETIGLINLKPQPKCRRCKISNVPEKGDICDYCIEAIIEGEGE